MLRYPKRSVPFRFSDYKFLCNLLGIMYGMWPSHHILLDLISLLRLLFVATSHQVFFFILLVCLIPLVKVFLTSSSLVCITPPYTTLACCNNLVSYQYAVCLAANKYLSCKGRSYRVILSAAREASDIMESGHRPQITNVMPSGFCENTERGGT
jgi:hypothetical protein